MNTKLFAFAWILNILLWEEKINHIENDEVKKLAIIKKFDNLKIWQF